MSSEEFTRALVTKNNDQSFVLYFASIIRAITALHNLINNKLQNKEAEKVGQEMKDDKKEGEKKEADKKDGDKKEEKGKDDKAAKK